MKWVVLAVAATLALAGVAQAAPPSLSYRLHPEAPTNCAGGTACRSSSTWDWDNGHAEPSAGNCNDQTLHSRHARARTSPARSRIDAERRHHRSHRDHPRRPHRARRSPGPASAGRRIATTGSTIRSRSSSPARTQRRASTLARAAPTAGSDGAGVSISGSCRDVAGNVTSGAFALNYDATPPPKPTVAVLPGDHRVAISWSSAQNEAEIVRIGKASSQAVVYRGPTESFTDRRLAQRTSLPLRRDADRPSREPKLNGHERRAHRFSAASARERRAPEECSHAGLEARQARSLLQRAAAAK